MDIVQTSVSLFMPPPLDKSIQKEYWVEFNPIATISEGGVIEFNIPGTSLDYINLAKSRLNIFVYLFIWGFTSLSTLYRSYHDR